MSTNNESLAMQRIAKLVDENSFMEIGSLVTARSTDFNLTAAKTPSDGVIIGHGLIDGNLVFIYSQDASVLNGTIGEMHAKKIASVYDMAMKMGAPVIGLIDCGGVRLQESVDALDGFGTIYAKEVAASGVVPQICGVFGNCGGGLAVVPAISHLSRRAREECLSTLQMQLKATAQRSATLQVLHSRVRTMAALILLDLRMRLWIRCVHWFACFREIMRVTCIPMIARMI